MNKKCILQFKLSIISKNAVILINIKLITVGIAGRPGAMEAIAPNFSVTIKSSIPNDILKNNEINKLPINRSKIKAQIDRIMDPISGNCFRLVNI